MLFFFKKKADTQTYRQMDQSYGGNRTSEHSNFDVTTSEISKKKGNKVTNPVLNAMKKDTD